MKKPVILWWGLSCVMVLVFGNWSFATEKRTLQQTIPMLIVTPTVIPTPTEIPVRSVLLEVPFTSQAPYGEWSDKRHQDGCEEASIIMAYCALFNDECEIVDGKLEKTFAKKEMARMADWEQRTYGSFVDTSAKDTAERLMEGFYGVKNYQVKKVDSWTDIVHELNTGNIVITPMNGQKLNNPNFTGVGPERHMVLVRGVDMENNEFITNDPGTRKGELYRYPVDVFWEAIRDYVTGDHAPIVTTEKKMIVVKS